MPWDEQRHIPAATSRSPMQDWAIGWVDQLERITRDHAQELFASVDIHAMMPKKSSGGGTSNMAKIMAAVDFLSMPKAERDQLILDRVIAFVRPQIEAAVLGRTNDELRTLAASLAGELEAALAHDAAESAHE